MANSKSNYLITDTSILKSVQYEMDKKDNLTITTVSPFKSGIDVIPLDMINPEPKLEKRTDGYWAMLGLILIATSILIFSLSHYFTSPYNMILGSGYLALAILTITLILSNKKNVATFYFINTQTKLFSITLPHGDTENNCLKDANQFVRSLTKGITELNKQNSIEPSHSFTDMNMNELYNYGIIDEFLYTRIKNRINDAVNRVDSKPHKKTESSNIIEFKPHEKSYPKSA